jgi:hypothetical protein
MKHAAAFHYYHIMRAGSAGKILTFSAHSTHYSSVTGFIRLVSGMRMAGKLYPLISYR